MRIYYQHAGPTIRQVAGYEWNKANRFIQDVDTSTPDGPGLVQNLLTYPDLSFRVAPDDPLARLVGVERAAELAIYSNVFTPEEYEVWQRAQVAKVKLFLETPGEEGRSDTDE